MSRADDSLTKDLQMLNILSKSSLICYILLLAGYQSAIASTVFNDGQTHSADSTGPFDHIRVDLNTTLNVLPGANIVADDGFGSGIYNTRGSIVNVLGGNVLGDSTPGPQGSRGIQTDESQVHIYGGLVRGFGGGGPGLLSYDSQISIAGGVLDSVSSHTLLLYLGSTASITGGSLTGALYSIVAFDQTVVTIRGGTFQSAFDAWDDSVFHVYGTNLAYDPTTDLLTGILQGGETINLTVRIHENAQLILHEIPEPSAFSLALFGVIGILAIRRWRWCHA